MLGNLDEMSVDERLALIEAIWDSIVAHPDQIPLTEAQKQELDRRLAAHRADPSKVTPWEVVKAEALARMSK
jgi:putative addiction module component (TIGR02574 family)